MASTVETCGYNEILANLPSYSRVSSLSEKCLQLQIVSTKVMTSHMEEGVNFLYLNATLFFFGVCSCSYLVTTDYTSCFILSMFTTFLFQLVNFVISMFIGNLLTSIQVVLVVF